jgi:hypothetical protein
MAPRRHLPSRTANPTHRPRTPTLSFTHRRGSPWSTAYPRCRTEEKPQISPCLYQGKTLTGCVLFIKARLNRPRKSSCFVSGHDSSRAVHSPNRVGLQPLRENQVFRSVLTTDRGCPTSRSFFARCGIPQIPFVLVNSAESSVRCQDRSEIAARSSSHAACRLRSNLLHSV